MSDRGTLVGGAATHLAGLPCGKCGAHRMMTVEILLLTDDGVHRAGAVTCCVDCDTTPA